MSSRLITIAGTGHYLPSHVISAQDMDNKLGKHAGWSLKHKQVEKRYVASQEETSAYMAMRAANVALAQAGIAPDDVECIIFAATSMQQPIPSTAVLIKKELGLDHLPTPAFDINSTCLSFLTALDVVSYMIDGGRFSNALVISSEKPSLAVNWDDLESCTLFSDGAAAAVIVRSDTPYRGTILSAHMENYSSGAEYCEIKAGGTAMPPGRCDPDLALFSMRGKDAYKLSSEHLHHVITTVLKQAGITLNDIDCVVPHQASPLAMQHLVKRIGIREDKLINIFAAYGNQVAASIPMALDYAVRHQRIKRGDKLLLIGTAAGISLGAMVVEY